MQDQWCQTQTDREAAREAAGQKRWADSPFWHLICDCGETHVSVSRDVWSATDPRGVMVTLYTSEPRDRFPLRYRLAEAWAWLRGRGYNEVEAILAEVELAKIHELSAAGGWHLERQDA